MTSSNNLPDGIGRFAISIFTVNGLLMRGGDRITRSIGQSSARWQVLGRASYAPQTVAQMARDLGITRQSVQRVADILAVEGLITYIENPKDKRARIVELTAKGGAALASIEHLNDEWVQRIMTKLNDSQLHSLADALANIAAILAADITSNATSANNPKEEK